MVGGFYGMFLLSEKRSRSLVWWVYTEYTPIACITSTAVFSQARTWHACLWLKISWVAAFLCAGKESVIRSAMSSLCWSLPHLLSSSQQLEAPRPPPRRHCTPSTSSKNYAVHKRRSRTALARQSREWRKPAQHLSHSLRPMSLSPKSLRPKSLRQFLDSLEDIYQLYDVQREFGEQDQRAPVMEEVKEFGQIGTKFTRSRDGRDVTCWGHVLPPVPDALRRVYGKHWRWRDKKIADLISVCP